MLINQNLEAMAKQLYDYWFVQFDFPNEDGKPYKSSGGEMVWNEKLKRKIPKQWENCTLSYYVGRITNGLNPRKNFAIGDGDNYYVTIRSLLGTDIDWNNCDRCNDEALAKINARSQLQIGDVIFSAIGTIGRTYYIQENPVNWNISETSFTLRANPNIPSELFYSILRSDEVQLQADYRNQIDTYLPQFTGAEVAVKFRDHQFQIFVQINNTAFAWLYDIDEDQITANYSRLSDL